MSGARIQAVSQSLLKVHQLPSHAHLSKDVSRLPAPPLRSRRGHLDAIIVPASRPAVCLQQTIKLSAHLGVLVVVLCSKQTSAKDVEKLALQTPGARTLVISMPETWSHPDFPYRTSADEFRQASSYRDSDLSAKRNIGLLLARLQGWSKIAFIDDDIKLRGIRNITRLAGELENHQVAGMRVLRHPDNSVVCHARRLARLRQGVFVTGAVLGVHCNSLPLSFFPDIYNEDWFFFASEAAARDLPSVGYARQAEYNPFDCPERARREEFGDLLAEGLYALMDTGNSAAASYQGLAATPAYWSRFIDARREVLSKTTRLLSNSRDQDVTGETRSALTSLAAAESQLNTITPDLCLNFLEAWWTDLNEWRKFSTGTNGMGSTREAMDFLNLESWILVGVDAVGVNSPAARVTHKRDALLTSREQDPLSASVKDASVKELSCGLVFDSIIALHETGFADGRATVTVSPKVDLFRVPSSILG